MLLATASCWTSACDVPTQSDVDRSKVVLPAPHFDVPQHIPPRLTSNQLLVDIVEFRELPRFRAHRYELQSSTERRDVPSADLLGPLIANANRDMNNFLCLGPNARGLGPYNIPFELDAPKCPTRHARGYVMAHFEGRGHLARLWFTASSLQTHAPDREALLFYVDGTPTPSIILPLGTLLEGKDDPRLAPPFGAGSSRYLAWYYPVDFERSLTISIDGTGPADLYYYEAAAALELPALREAPIDGGASPEAGAEKPSDAGTSTAEPHAGPENEALRQHAARVLGDPPVGPTHTLKPFHALPAGASLDALEWVGPQVLDSLTLSLPSRRDFERLRISVFWDEENEPAIDVPAHELFGTSWGVPHESGVVLRSLPRPGSTSVELRLPMPFRQRARLRLTRVGPGTLSGSVETHSTPGQPRGTWGYLHVQRHETLKSPAGSTQPARHPIASAARPGRLVGVCLLLEGHGFDASTPHAHPFNFLEGDSVWTLDGRHYQGTGTEDYLNDAFYFATPSTPTPFAQSRAHLQATRGKVNGCRWHIGPDAVDFQRELNLELEIGPAAPELLERYTSIAFLYL